MTPIGHFEAVWNRCSQLSALHAYLERNVGGILQPDELLRAEWVARVSALDLYIHEIVAQKMLEIFEGRRPATSTYLKFHVSTETLNRIRTAATPSDASAAFDLFVRSHLGRNTYQFPEDIADGVRLCSPVELWNEVATILGATPASRADKAKEIKRQLSLLIDRRNKIAHEGDLQQSPLREPWPVSRPDLLFVGDQVERIVRAIDAVV
jgi:hypothetical protein